MTVRASLCALFLASGLVVAHGQSDPRPAPGLTHPHEVRTGGWSYEYDTLDAGTGDGDWPSCGGVLDLRAGERSVSGSLVFAPQLEWPGQEGADRVATGLTAAPVGTPGPPGSTVVSAARR